LAAANAAPCGAKVIAFTSGKGGVGKSNIAAAMAVLLAQCGKRVLLVDGDLGLANIDVLFGLKPRLTLHHVVRDGRGVEEALVQGPAGVWILPGGSGLQELAALGEAQLQALLTAFRGLDSRMDYILYDTPAGISLGVTSFLEQSDQIVLVTMPEPTAVTDAYALIKVLSRRGRSDGIGILVNQADEAEGRSIFRGLSWVTEQFLGQSLEYIGHAPCDPVVGEAVRRQQSVAAAYPGSPFVSGLRALALKWINDQTPPATGGMEALAREAVAVAGNDSYSS